MVSGHWISNNMRKISLALSLSPNMLAQSQIRQGDIFFYRNLKSVFFLDPMFI